MNNYGQQLTNHDTSFGKFETPKYRIIKKKNQKEDTKIYVWVRTQESGRVKPINDTQTIQSPYLYMYLIQL